MSVERGVTFTIPPPVFLCAHPPNASPNWLVLERVYPTTEETLSDKHYHSPINGNLRFKIDDPMPFLIDFDPRQMA